MVPKFRGYFKFMPDPEEGCCFNRGIGDKQCTAIVYVKDLLVTCKDEVAMVGFIDALKTKYNEVQEHTSVKHSFLGTSLNMTEVGLCSITMPTFLADLVKDVELGSIVIPASNKIFMINDSNPLLKETRTKQFHESWRSCYIWARESGWIS